jgi:starch synthase
LEKNGFANSRLIRYENIKISALVNLLLPGNRCMHILLVAAENDALEGGKVGGVGDVIRNAGPALASLGCQVTVVIPSHGFLHTLEGARPTHTIRFRFRGYPHWANLFEIASKTPQAGVRHLVVHHEHLSAWDPFSQRHRIYVHDSPDRPFYTDASRFALFSTAVAAAASQEMFGPLDVIHLHDWHTAPILILRKFDPEFKALQSTRFVFTIHNLALQGVRPFQGSDSSLEAWFPRLSYDWLALSDPRWSGCVNLMAAGIRLADVVHTVSPSYAEEILHPSEKPRYYGGEGLEPALRYTKECGALIGILNGCAYPEGRRAPETGFDEMSDLFVAKIIQWAGRQDPMPASLFIAYSRLMELRRRKTDAKIVLCSVSRLVDQKLRLMRESGSASTSALERILVGLGDRGYYFLLGAGEDQYGRFFAQVSSRHDNFIFLNGYSDRCAEALYANGDLFLMPSSFEPCGISQMLAMREGQPCVAHAVGGLKDTVQDGSNGFLFSGKNLTEQVENFVRTTLDAVALRQSDPAKWRDLRRRAAASRFLWQDTARQYIDKLYP